MPVAAVAPATAPNEKGATAARAAAAVAYEIDTFRELALIIKAFGNKVVGDDSCLWKHKKKIIFGSPIYRNILAAMSCSL